MPKTDTLPVIFRAERAGKFEGQVTAVFPTLPGTNQWNATCYAHIGQHGACSREWYLTTRRAAPHELFDLLHELRGIYESGPERVRLVPAKRWTRYHDDARRNACKL